MIKAARYLGVPPWDLLEAPAIWLEAAVVAESSEITAENKRMKDANRKANKRGR